MSGHVSSAGRVCATVCFATWVLTSAALGQTGWTTRSFDNNRTGCNPNETGLTPKNVNTGQFGLIFTRPLDGEVFAQPLVAPNVKIPNQGTFNVVYVATEHDSVYAYDADNAWNSQPLWHRSFLDSARGVTTIPAVDLGPATNIWPEVGITSTPVIDINGGTIYLVVSTLEGPPSSPSSFVQRLWALDLATGTPKFGGPVVISGSVQGSGAASVNGEVHYDVTHNNQRPALVLSNGKIYFAVASFGDFPPYHGWVLQYDAKTLKQTALLCTTPNGSDGGIWMSGAAMPIDAEGNVYTVSGNGTFDSSGDFGDSILKLSPTALNVLDHFTPFDQAILDSTDNDLGICGPMLIPHTSLLVQGAKNGKLYVCDTNSLGGFNAAGDNQIVQWWWGCNGQLFGTPVFWAGGANGNLMFVWSAYDVLKAFAFNGQAFNPVPVATGTPYDGRLGGILSISSNGSNPATAIVWAVAPLDPDNYNSGNGGASPAGVLRAFNATTLVELWNSKTAAGDDFGLLSKFVPPTIANHKVYVVSNTNELAVYGELPKVAPPAPGLTAEAGSKEVALSWPAPHGASSYQVFRGGVGGPYTQIATVKGTIGFYDDQNLTNGRTYAYRVVAVNAYGSSLQSNEASATPTAQNSPSTASGLLGTYYNDTSAIQPFVTPVLQRVDATINFAWEGISPGGSVQPLNFSTIWYGTLVAPETGYYTMQTLSSDGVRVWLRGEEVINNWTSHPLWTNDSLPVLLVGGKSYPIQIEFYAYDDPQSRLQFNWLVPGAQTFALVPSTNLFTYPSSTPFYDAPVDMGPNFNVNGLSYLNDPTSGDLGYEFETFAAESMPRYSSFNHASGPDFIIGPGYPGALNVIECAGQTVPTPAYCAKFVDILGCAVGGSQSGTFTLSYSDGSSSLQTVTFTDWNASRAQNGEALEQNFGLRHNPRGNVVTATSLFQYSIVSTSSKRLVSITLPSNPQMKVLSVSVVR